MFIMVCILFYTFVCSAMQEDISLDIIDNASYVIFQGASTEILNDISPLSQEAYFYTHDGTLLETVPHTHNYSEIRAMLDTKAPRPQPTAYAIESRSQKNEDVPLDYIIFYDKHHNVIQADPFFRSERNIITTNTPQHEVVSISLPTLMMQPIDHDMYDPSRLLGLDFTYFREHEIIQPEEPEKETDDGASCRSHSRSRTMRWLSYFRWCRKQQN